MSSGVYITNMFDSVYFGGISINTIKEIKDKLNESKDCIMLLEKQLFTFAFINHINKFKYFELYKEFEDLLDAYKEALYGHYRYEQIESMIDYEHVKIYDEDYGYFIKINGEFVQVSEGEYNEYAFDKSIHNT